MDSMDETGVISVGDLFLFNNVSREGCDLSSNSGLSTMEKRFLGKLIANLSSIPQSQLGQQMLTVCAEPLERFPKRFGRRKTGYGRLREKR